MHAPASAAQLWQAWRRIEEERAAVLAIAHGEPQDVPSVRWGRQCFTSAEAILSASPPGWARLDAAAMRRHRERATTLAAKLKAIQRAASGRRGAPSRFALERRAQQLADEANRLAAAIQRAPITTPADVLARLDLIAAMWGADGEIGEPGKPLAEVLELMEGLSRHAPQFVPTWTRRRAAQIKVPMHGIIDPT